MSCFQAFRGLCQRVVKPNRHYLNQNHLIAQKMKHQRMSYQKFLVMNKRGEMLSVIATISDPTHCYPAVIYLHGNGGYKLQCLQIIRPQFNLISFDFAGCGQSEGQYLTYGDNQVEDVQCVVAAVYERYAIKRIALWGRSMGSCIAILYASLYPQHVVSMVLDSPFNCLEQIIMNVADHSRPLIPNFVLQFVVFLMKNKITDIVQVDVFKHDFSKHLNLIEAPILFAYSNIDTVVQQADVRKLYASYRGIKQLYSLGVAHQKDRPQRFIHAAYEFIKNESSTKTNVSTYSKKGISMSTRPSQFK